ncbi:MAG: calcium/sodium antiporter [Planctomycetota bacterium]|nr:calcium/sodium antiporter [Planctomycetota bacterium]
MDPLTVIYLVVGFVLLWKGGDLLVDGADAFARSHGVPPTLAGVFILGFGTSMPELAVTALAALDGEAGIAVGNVVGSNIANVALVLGTAALLGVVHVNRFLLKVEMPVGILASILGFVLVMDGTVDSTDGLILLGAFAVYMGFALGTVRHRDIDEGEPPPKRAWFDLGKAALALAAVLGGAELFKTGAINTAEALGVDKVVIGSTLVALATSLPELATAIAAARVHKTDLVLGNIIGSNIFNLLLVLGTAGVLVDQAVDKQVPTVLMPLMLGLAILPFVIALVLKRTIGRYAGLLMLLIYIGFIAYQTTVALGL